MYVFCYFLLYDHFYIVFFVEVFFFFSIIFRIANFFPYYLLQT